MKRVWLRQLNRKVGLGALCFVLLATLAAVALAGHHEGSSAHDKAKNASAGDPDGVSETMAPIIGSTDKPPEAISPEVAKGMLAEFQRAQGAELKALDHRNKLEAQGGSRPRRPPGKKNGRSTSKALGTGFSPSIRVGPSAALTSRISWSATGRFSSSSRMRWLSGSRTRMRGSPRSARTSQRGSRSSGSRLAAMRDLPPVFGRARLERWGPVSRR